MGIYSGPATEKFDHYFTSSVKMSGGLGHDQVDNRNLSDDTEPWSGEKVIRVNLSKDYPKRQKIGHIILTEGDIIALHKGLIKGLQESSRAAEQASKVIADLPLKSIGTAVNRGNIQDDKAQALGEIRKLLR